MSEEGGEMGPNLSELRAEVTGALQSAIDAHGPIDRSNVSSAMKRVMGAFKAWSKRNQFEPFLTAEDLAGFSEETIEELKGDAGAVRYVSEEAFAHFIATCVNPPEPTPKLKALFAKRKKPQP